MTRMGLLTALGVLLVGCEIQDHSLALSPIVSNRGAGAASNAGENPIPAPTPTLGAPAPLRPTTFPTCRSDDPSKLCLALRYVGYTDNSGQAAVDEAQALKNLEGINRIWKQCGIAFQIDDFQLVRPVDYKLQYSPSGFNDFDHIRESFDTGDKLLVVTTGTWDRCCGLSANAWTTMPGESGPFGVIMEKTVGNFHNIVAHELGHYLSLNHLGNRANIMNPTIYSSSTELSGAQCSAARAAAVRYWSPMLR